MFFLSFLNKKDLRNKTCLLRVDLNIENSEFFNGNHQRISAVISTLKFLIKNKTKVIILSHRGRPMPAKLPNSKFQIPNSKEFSLKPFAGIFSKKLNKKVNFINGFDFAVIKKKINNSPESVFMLENLRFLAGEEKNDARLAEKLAGLGDFFVNDAFGVSHRENASVSAIAEFIPSFAGFLIEKEINNLNKAIKNPKKPLVVILGGAKVSDKIGVIKNFINKADYFLIGGEMANIFLAAQDLPVGESFYEKEAVSSARRMIKFKKIILPIDLMVEKGKILDIGSATIEKYSKIIKNAKTIIWNGPMGYFENPKFAKGSEGIAKAIMANKKAFSVIGGGETAALFQNSKFPCLPAGGKVQSSKKLFISTGGGAMLKFLAGEKLPGIEALSGPKNIL